MVSEHNDSVARRLVAELARIGSELPAAEVRGAAHRIGAATAVLRGLGAGHDGVDTALAELAEVRDRLTTIVSDFAAVTSALEPYAGQAVGMPLSVDPADGDGVRR